MKFVLYHNPLWGHHNQIGIVVSRNKNNTLLVSIPKFGGDYLTLNPDNPCVTCISKTITKEQLLLTMAAFGEWWFTKHRLLFQDILVHHVLA
jgi:hypothetical protein